MCVRVHLYGCALVHVCGGQRTTVIPQDAVYLESFSVVWILPIKLGWLVSEPREAAFLHLSLPPLHQNYNCSTLLALFQLIPLVLEIELGSSYWCIEHFSY